MKAKRKGRKKFAYPTPPALSRVLIGDSPFPDDVGLPPFLVRLDDATLAAVLKAWHEHTGAAGEAVDVFVGRIIAYVRRWQVKQREAHTDAVRAMVRRGWIWRGGVLYSPMIAREEGWAQSDPLPSPDVLATDTAGIVCRDPG